MHRSRISRLALLALLAVTAAFGLRCGDNANEPLLEPPTSAAAEGTISGVLDWGISAPWPETVVYAIASYDPSCAGTISSIHITGTYNNWDEEAWTTAPGMTQLFPCFWTDELDLDSDDDFAWKFVTDAGWDGSYAGCGDCDTDEDAMRGEVKAENGDDILVPISEDGDYWFLLNASSDPGLFQIVTPEAVPWDTVGGDSAAFLIENLEEGIYTLIIETPENQEEFPRRIVRGVIVSGEEGTDVGTIEVVPTGYIAGKIQFSDSPAARPGFTVKVLFAESGAVADSFAYTAADTSFKITGLNEDAYDIRLHADGYVDSTIQNLAFAPGDKIDLGTITLVRAGSASGVIAFADNPDTRPVVTVTGSRAGSDVMLAVTTSDAGGLYTLSGLPPGSVDLQFSASKYIDTTFTGVTIVSGADVALDTIVMQPGCVSVASSIHLLGHFNGWDESLWISDVGMRQTESCIWRDTIVVYPQYAVVSSIKFVVDGAWGNDYAYCSADEFVPDTLVGAVCLGGDADIAFLAGGVAGRYEMVLDEDSLQYRGFLLDEFTGGFSGTVSFDTGLQPPFPAIVLEVRKTGETMIVASVSADSDDGTFTVSGLDDGSYDVLFTGSTFRDTTITSTVAGGALTDLGDVVLTEVQFQSEFTVIRVVGDFNGWNTSSASMNQIEPGVWVDTISVGASALCPFMKFRTAEDWGNNDYFNCSPQDNSCTTPLSGDICHGSGADGDPPALGKLQFPEAGDYEFRLDEVNLTYEITLIE